MHEKFADAIVEEFEQGQLSRRELVGRLMGLGVAFAAMPNSASAAPAANSLFQATDLDHVALNVEDLSRSREFYEKHLGLKVVMEGGKDYCFLGANDGKGFILALFENKQAGLNHYCYAIKVYDPDKVLNQLQQAGLKPRREADRIYFDDPDGITVQVTGD